MIGGVKESVIYILQDEEVLFNVFKIFTTNDVTCRALGGVYMEASQPGYPG